MRFLDRTLPALAHNLALDEALLLAAEAGDAGEMLRCWTWPTPAVVLGAGGIVADDVNEAECSADGVPLVRRSSGGGTVLLGPGCLLFSLILDMNAAQLLQQIGSSYRHILGRVANCLGDIQPGIELAGISDLAVAGRKFSGNAQQRKRRFLLHHGTLLHRFDPALAGRYLRMPPRRPEYRGDRPHADFLTNLPERPDKLISQLRIEWGAAEDQRDWPEMLTRRLVADKYAREDWTRRR